MNARQLIKLSGNSVSRLLSILTAAVLGCSLTGCGSGVQMGSPTSGGNTQVEILVTSTANDQLIVFDVGIKSILLVNSAGQQATIYINPDTFDDFVEWMHLNGASEPFLAVSVPQGTYTSAIVTIGGCSFTNETFSAGTFDTATYSQELCGQGSGLSTVNFPNPIRVTGSSMALSLNLQVSQSYTLDATANPAAYTISPVFTLTPISIAAQPTNETNGKVTGVNAQLTSVGTDGKSLTAKTTAGVLLNLSLNATTTYQGIAGFSGLETNSLVNFDAAIQSDGSLLVTRAEVDDAAVATAVVGPFLLPGSQAGQFLTVTLQTEGCTFIANPFCGNIFQSGGNTVFSISGQFTNVANLPFTPTFSSSTLLQGQNVTVWTPGIPNAQSIENASTVTLEPQTLNGTVTAVSSDSGFAAYTVTLAPYDLIPILQNYTSFTPPPHLIDPTTVIVYTDANALLLNSGTVNVGSLLRFRGLVFDDNGTLRMDCGAIYDGVPE